ncbi:gluconate 5-dehydrogenase [Pseudovirgaria hyperparasitica]|uniref:Gluconate 5-dehydrogenase n=1 Tax=Pseudovirgaria hyperparasitica TaxID=470096 RepID=A0A6A6W7S8_9PEZI|nr:gluconate 5-dehydrogenase [Pseudovirgaria hyperparasitica]KAF2757131.1 gluconate 5-dehydrogenase [Pseudovirgaria hyperparasitica]
MSAEADVKLQDFSNIFSLEGKVAVVSGGSRGLGLHSASGLLQAGCSKVFITSRKAKACEEACAALNALPNKRPGAQAISVPADSSKISEIDRLVAEVAKHTDHVDILFANAGATWGEAFDKFTESAFDKVMDLNVKSVFFTVQKFAPLLRKNASTADPARVLVTGSVAGINTATLGKQATFSYAASKAAVLHLARNLAMSFATDGDRILVNSVAPGFFPSKMSNGLLEMSGGAESAARANPNGRLGNAEDVAAAVVFLCSRAGGHVNGHTLVLDGGKIYMNGKL